MVGKLFAECGRFLLKCSHPIPPGSAITLGRPTNTWGRGGNARAILATDVTNIPRALFVEHEAQRIGARPRIAAIASPGSYTRKS
jgi:hypothetical protein